MRVEVTDIETDERGAVWVTMHTHIGTARVLASCRCRPFERGARDVEIDVEARLDIGDNAMRTSEREPRWDQRDGRVIWVALVDAVDDDGML